MNLSAILMLFLIIFAIFQVYKVPVKENQKRTPLDYHKLISSSSEESSSLSDITDLKPANVTTSTYKNFKRAKYLLQIPQTYLVLNSEKTKVEPEDTYREKGSYFIFTKDQWKFYVIESGSQNRSKDIGSLEKEACYPKCFAPSEENKSEAKVLYIKGYKFLKAKIESNGETFYSYLIHIDDIDLVLFARLDDKLFEQGILENMEIDTPRYSSFTSTELLNMMQEKVEQNITKDKFEYFDHSAYVLYGKVLSEQKTHAIIVVKEEPLTKEETEKDVYRRSGKVNLYIKERVGNSWKTILERKNLVTQGDWYFYESEIRIQHMSDDEKPDILIGSWSSAGSNSGYYLWINQEDHFQEIPDFDELSQPIYLPESNTYFSHADSGCAGSCYRDQVYKLQGTKLVLIKEITQGNVYVTGQYSKCDPEDFLRQIYKVINGKKILVKEGCLSDDNAFKDDSKMKPTKKS